VCVGDGGDARRAVTVARVQLCMCVCAVSVEGTRIPACTAVVSRSCLVRRGKARQGRSYEARQESAGMCIADGREGCEGWDLHGVQLALLE